MRNGQPQKSTLSIRVSESLREHLQHAKCLLANAREGGVSLSDVAKLLLESAVNDRLDHRFEAATLHIEPTVALARIRQKWELEYPLNHAEWLLLAEFVQSGCEAPCANPDLPGPESVAQVLLAFLAVRSLRTERGVQLDRHYLGNLGWQPTNDRQLDPELVTEVVQQMLPKLREQRTRWNRHIFAARNLFIAIRDERVPSIIGLNDALWPYLPTLFCLAARGHWLRIRQPIRTTATGCYCSFALSPFESDSVRLEVLVSEGELQVVINFATRGVTYPLRNYPLIRDLGNMLKCLKSGSRWNGAEFFGYWHCAESASDRVGFCHRASGIEVRCEREEWDSLGALFWEALSRDELQPVLSKLRIEYGEI